MERIYYDGACGLCRGWVRWILRRDGGARYRFAPLGGETFGARVPPARRSGMRGTVVLEAADGRLLLRSDAVLAVLRALGRRRTAAVVSLLPRPLRDLAYRCVALLRRALPAPRADACPAGDPALRARFDP